MVGFLSDAKLLVPSTTPIGLPETSSSQTGAYMKDFFDQHTEVFLDSGDDDFHAR